MSKIDAVKSAVAAAVFDALTRANNEGRLMNWEVEISRIQNLQATMTVRPPQGGPRRMFVIQVREVM